MRKILFLTVIAVMTVSCTVCESSKAKDKKVDSEMKTETETEEGLFNWSDNFYSQFEGVNIRNVLMQKERQWES